jgi:hypothetical protein
MRWNESSDYSITARYNLTGLAPNTYYNVYNFSAKTYSLQTDASGNLNFTIALNTTSREIKVEQVNVSFKVLLPDNSITNSSSSGSSTSDEDVNATVSTVANVSPCVRGSANCQTTLVSNFRINNTGNVNENITMCINQSLSSKFTIFGTLTNNSYASPTIIPNCSYSVWKANESLPMNAVDEFWIWTNFTGVTIYDSAARELFVNSTEAG